MLSIYFTLLTISSNTGTNQSVGYISKEDLHLNHVFHLNSRVSFVKRQTNLVVHNLARTSRFYVNSHVFNYTPMYCFPHDKRVDITIVPVKKKLLFFHIYN